MRMTLAQNTEHAGTTTPLGAKLLNMLVSPSIVFDEVAACSTRSANWLVPTASICLSSLAVLNTTTEPERIARSLQELLGSANISAEQAAGLRAHWWIISGMAICVFSFLGVFWSAVVLWFIGRFLLKSQVAFAKALEIAGLSATILVLGTVVTGLLALATGDALARPALSLLFFKSDLSPRLRAASEALNGFYLWTTVVLAIGLSRLSGASFKESAFWVFGYWVVARIGLILLA